jgi:hypothetical protein
MRALVLVACAALTAPAHAQDFPADWPEPLKCYALAGGEADPTITVGMTVDLCAGTTNAEATADCYAKAFTLLGLTRGQAVRLCSAKTREPL